MRFSGFYGNRALQARLSQAAQNGGLSHCYLLVGPQGSGKKTLSRILAAALQCTAAGEIPCGVCPSCHKIFGGGHPDVITVDSDKATVPIRVIREMQADAYIRPNEGKKKIYLIPRGQDMQAPAQNALLKLLEEPPSYCVFLLMTDSAEKILPTVRSRAVELKLFPLAQEEEAQALKALRPKADAPSLASAMEGSGGYLGKALERLDAGSQQEAHPLVEALCRGDELTLLEALVPLEKYKRPELLASLQQLQLLLTRALGCQKAGMQGSQDTQALANCLTPQQIFATLEAISQAVTLLDANGSPGHCVGLLMDRLT